MIPVLTDLSIRIGLVFDALNRENHPLSAKSIIYTKIGPVQAGDQIGGVRRMTATVGVEEDEGRPGRRGEEEGEKGEGVEIDFATGQFVLDIIPNANLDPSRVRFGREAVVVLAQIGEPGATETVRPGD